MRSLRFLVLLIGLLIAIVFIAPVQGSIRARQDSPTPTPPVVLFHDDFSTHADRWKLFNLGKASIRYDATVLRVETNSDNYALWSVPDTDLKPDQFDMTLQGTWVTGDNDALFGIVVNYRSDSDMLVATVTRGGQVRIGNYYFGVLADLAKPTQAILDAAQPVTIHAILGAAGTLDIYVNNQKLQSITLKTFRTGSFGIFASSGGSGGLNVTFNEFTISQPGQPS